MEKTKNQYQKYGCLFGLAILATAMSMGLVACTSAVPVTIAPAIHSAPDLSGYNAFELFSQAAVATGKMQTEGSLQYLQESSQFEVYFRAPERMGRLHVQAEACRDDPDPECQRRFIVSGRIFAFESTLSCNIPIRNDSSLGYARQTLSGICQSQYGRTFTIHIYAR